MIKWDKRTATNYKKYIYIYICCSKFKVNNRNTRKRCEICSKLTTFQKKLFSRTILNNYLYIKYKFIYTNFHKDLDFML